MQLAMAGLRIFILISLLTLTTVVLAQPNYICDKRINAAFTSIINTNWIPTKYKHLLLFGNRIYEMNFVQNTNKNYNIFLNLTFKSITPEWPDFNEASAYGFGFGLNLAVDNTTVKCLSLNDSFYLCNVYPQLGQVRQQNVSIKWTNENRDAKHLIVHNFTSSEFAASHLFVLTQDWSYADNRYIRKIREYEIRGIEQPLNVSNLLNKTFNGPGINRPDMVNSLRDAITRENKIVGILIGESQLNETEKYVFVVYEGRNRKPYVCQFKPENLCQTSVFDIHQVAKCPTTTTTTTTTTTITTTTTTTSPTEETTAEDVKLEVETEPKIPANATVPFTREFGLVDKLLFLFAVALIIAIFSLIAYLVYQRRHRIKYSPIQDQTDSEDDSESDSRSGKSAGSATDSKSKSSDTSNGSSISSGIKSKTQSGIRSESKSGSSLGQRSDIETPKKARSPKKMMQPKKPTKKVSSCLFDSGEDSSGRRRKDSDSSVKTFKTVLERRY